MAELLFELPPDQLSFLGDAIEDHSSIVPIAQFFADAKSGNLPGFAIIDPDFGHSSEENPQNIVHGEVFAASVVQAVMESPAWPRTDFLDLKFPEFAHPPALAQPLAGPAQVACEKSGPGTIPPPGSVTPG